VRRRRGESEGPDGTHRRSRWAGIGFVGVADPIEIRARRQPLLDDFDEAGP
jgi:hypothetical protein